MKKRHHKLAGNSAMSLIVVTSSMASVSAIAAKLKSP
jgi:hypothetical protein